MLKTNEDMHPQSRQTLQAGVFKPRFCMYSTLKGTKTLLFLLKAFSLVRCGRKHTRILNSGFISVRKTYLLWR